MKKLLLIMLALVIAGLALAQTDITIGTGTSTGRYPLNDYFMYSRSQCIYLESEIGAPGTIHKLRWYRNDTGADPLAIGTTQIWLKTVSNAVMTDVNWEDPGTMVAEISNIDLGAGNAWYEIDITDFAYSGGNLLVSAYTQNAPYTTPHSYWRYTATTGFNRCRLGNSDSSNPPTLSLSTARPNIQINMTTSAPSVAPNPAILAAPMNGGYAMIGDILSWNSGGGFPATYDVYLDTVDGSTLVSDNQAGLTYTPTLAPGTTYYWKVVPANAFGDAMGCPVWSFMTPGATQIVESFENTTFPPAGWANGTTGNWTRSTSYAKHGTASAYKYGSSTTAYVLSTPRLTIEHDSTLDIWTLASSATGTLQVVYSPDRVTWTPLGTPIAHAATYVWYNTVADLSSLAGNNYYLGIQTGLQSASFYVDLAIAPEITPEAPGAPALSAPADLAINVSEFPTLSWTAPTTGGVPTGYNLYMDTVDGSTLYASGVSSPYAVPVVLDYETTYYWTVEALNGAGTGPQATVRSFTTRANPTISTFPWEVTFGTTASDWPVLNWSQLINQYGTALDAGTRWYQDDFVNVASPLNKAAKMNIWSANYGWLVTPPIAIPAAGYELKFDIGLTAYGSTSAVTAGGQPDDKFMVLVDDNPNMSSPTILREWNNTGSPYVYDNVSNTGENHIIDLDAYTGTVYFAFYGETSVSNGDNDFFVDNVIVRETPAAPIFSYAPTAIDFGTVMQNVAATAQNVTVTNTGGGTINLTTANISITGTDAAMFSYVATNLPAALAGGQSVTIPVTVTVTSEGAKTATLTINYNSVNYDVALSATGLPAGLLVIGNGTANNNLPVNPYYGYTYSQSIFLQSEINVPDQRIESVYYYWNGLAEAVDSNDWTIYMGHTAATEFASTTDWMPLANLSQVFSGTIALPATAGWIEIPLTAPFIYNNTDNLVIAVDENAPSYDGSSEFFYSTAAATNRSLRYYSDGTNPDPAAPVAGTLVLAYPNVMLQLGDIPTGPPLPVVMGIPADEAANQPAAGFNFTWSPDPLSGPIDYYAFFLSTDDQDLYGQFYGETTGNSFNPVGQPYGDGTFAFDFNTRYYWQVIAYQGVDEAASAVRWFQIEQDPDAPITDFPYLVDFEAHAANTLPGGWTRSSNATGWRVGTALGSTYWSVPAHTVYAATNDDAAGASGDGSMDLLVSPVFDFSGAHVGIPLLTFDSFFTGAYGQLAYVEVSTNGTDWTVLQDMVANPAWNLVTVSLADFDGEPYVKVRFHGDDAGEWASGWAVDNINIEYVNIDLMNPIVNHYPVIGWPDVANGIPIVAEVTDDFTWNSGIASVTLDYSVNAGGTVSVPMILDGGYYEAVIPAQAAGSTVAYSITAVDASAQANTTTTATWDFVVDSPVWLQYDNNVVSTSVGLASGTFGLMTGFENPFGPGAPLQVNSITGQFNSAINATVHVYVYDGTNFVDLIPSFNQAFDANVLTTIPLTGLTTTAGYFYVAFTDLVGPAYHAIDLTQAYYPATHWVHFGAGMTVAGLSTIESAGFPGSWFIRANVQAGTTALDAPVVTITNEVDGPTLTWDPVAGANSYNIYGSADPYANPFTPITSVGSSPYLYTGSEAFQFFQVTASSDGLPSKNATISTRVNQLRSMVSNRKLNQAPKATVK